MLVLSRVHVLSALLLTLCQQGMDAASQSNGSTVFAIPEMASNAKKELLDMCSEPNKRLWHVCYPSSSSVDKPPSAKSFEVLHIGGLDESIQDILLPVIGSIGEGLASVFSPSSGHRQRTLHNSSFWTTFIRNLIMDVSGGLMVRDSSRNVAEVRHLLLTPLLRSVAHCMAMMRSPETYDKDSLEYFSAFSLEENAERRTNRRGRKPQVDYALTAHTDGGEPLYVIPVEGKIKISDKDVSQLSQYLSTMGNGVYSSTKASVGLAVDESFVRFAFSIFSLQMKGKDVPLPIVLVSPSLVWRMGTAMQQSTCIAMCMCQLFNMTRIPIDSDAWKKAFGEVWKDVEQMTLHLAEDNFKIRSRQLNVPYDMLTEMQKLKDEVKALKSQLLSHMSSTATPGAKRGRVSSPPPL